MQKTGQDPLRILIVDDDADSVALVSRQLSEAGYEVRTASSGDEALKVLASEGAPIVITDWVMPGMSGLDLCRAIRHREGIGFAYVIVLTARTGEDQLVEAFEEGADDFLTKPYNRRELLARIRAGERIVQLRQDREGRQWEVHRINAEMSIAHTKLAEANEQLNRVATTDELTGLLNRREAMSRLAESWSASVRHQSPLACISLDIDHFKNFNDVYGHAVGDTVLCAVAKALHSTVRSGEPVCRIGGEEFLVLCPDATEAQAVILAERLREAVEQNVVRVDKLELAVTVSLGVAERGETMTVPDELLRIADDALYAAKDAGRNRSFRASVLSELDASSNDQPARGNGKSALPCRRDGTSGVLRILLADADTASRTTCQKVLETWGCEVDSVATGAEARACLERHSQDVILLAAKLADVHGLEYAQSLKADPATRDIPVILASSRQDGLDVSTCREAGVDEFISKPINAKELLVRVEAMSRFHITKKELVRSNQIRGRQSWILGLLLDFFRDLATARDLEETLDRTIRVVLQMSSSSRAAILLPDSTGQVLRIVRMAGIDVAHAQAACVAVAGSVSGGVFATGKARVMNDSDRSPAQADDETHFDGTTWVSLPLGTGQRVVGVLNVGVCQKKDHYNEEILEYLELTCSAAASAIHDHISRNSRQLGRNSIVFALAKLAEYRCANTGDHLERVTSCSLLIAEQLRTMDRYSSIITDQFLEDMKCAAPLHDIGKVAVPDSILNKPAALTSGERAIMETHAHIGASAIRSALEHTPDVSFLDMATQIAHCHHEWFDGGGYPRGLAADAIPLPARIVAIADVYDAVTTDRVYKDALPHEQTVRLIYDNSGLQFDPDIVLAFRACEMEIKRLSEELSDTAVRSAEEETPFAILGGAAI